jgi:hypothetical protein
VAANLIDLRAARVTCETVFQQLNDDMLIKAVDTTCALLFKTYTANRTLWLYGSDSGYLMAAEAARLLTKYEPNNKIKQSWLRASLVGTDFFNPANRRIKKHGIPAMDISRQASVGDCFWAFAYDPSSDDIIEAASVAHASGISVIVSTSYPGTPIAKFAHTAMRVQAIGDTDPVSSYCVESVHCLLTQLICNRIRDKIKKHNKEQENGTRVST